MRTSPFYHNLEYKRFAVANAAPPNPWFETRPSDLERSRRLAEVLLARTDVRKVAIAVPESGGDRGLARGVALAVKSMDLKESVLLTYSPGRRDYAPEVRKFRESGARAIVLTGPAGECGEWLIALRAANLDPLVLSSSEIDPSGLHERARRAGEGAIYVGDHWQPRPALEAEIARAADSTGFAAREDFAFGYLIGRNLVRLVLEGNITPARLTDALSRQAPQLLLGSTSVTSSPLDKGQRPLEVSLPLYVIRSGISERLPWGAAAPNKSPR